MVGILAKSAIFIKFVIFSIIDFLAISKAPRVYTKTLLLVRIDSIGDYVLFRNFIGIIKKSEKYKDYKITLCGNIAWKELAETFDREFISDFVWIDSKKLSRNIFTGSGF